MLFNTKAISDTLHLLGKIGQDESPMIGSWKDISVVERVELLQMT